MRARGALLLWFPVRATEIEEALLEDQFAGALALLEQSPQHQRNHYLLARLERAKDSAHVDQMETVLRESNLPPDRNIFLYYALGKEYEDLEQWDMSFDYYKRGGDAVVPFPGRYQEPAADDTGGGCSSGVCTWDRR